MNIEKSIKVFKDIFEKEILEIRKRKGHDYSGDEDSLSNLRDFGSTGVIVRLGDKYHRLKNFTKKGVLLVSDESVEDTFIDLITYGFLGLILYRQEKEKRDSVVLETKPILTGVDPSKSFTMKEFKNLTEGEAKL